MPLIEPQEWKEVQKVEEFAVVIDTSMSCSGELVRKFLEETYGVLSENDSFFRKVNIHLIQCDDKVQEGTDFRPAFAYVERLVKEHVFSNLRGLLYFTDGQGTYPAKMPAFETAFVFLKEDYEDMEVPSWAVKLILEESDIYEY